PLEILPLPQGFRYRSVFRARRRCLECREHELPPARGRILRSTRVRGPELGRRESLEDSSSRRNESTLVSPAIRRRFSLAQRAALETQIHVPSDRRARALYARSRSRDLLFLRFGRAFGRKRGLPGALRTH